MPKISVIVPVYNTEQYLPRCIDSILSQTFTDFELLLIDDGSKDSSGKICDEYAAKDSRIRVFHKENGGVSSARNLGLDNSQGEWIIFVDSDDWIESLLIDSCINLIQKHPKIDIIRYGYYEEKSSNKYTIRNSKENEITSSLPYFFEKCNNYGYWGYIWNTAFRKELISELRFNENINWCEDHIFTYKYFIKCKSMFLLSLPLYHYQYRQGLSCIKDAHMIILAAEQEFIVVSQIIGKNRATKEFYNKIRFAISVIYKHEKEYRVRKAFNKEIMNYSKVLDDADIYIQLYVKKIIPFLLKDIILRIKSHYNN